jgi:catechol 2,3-dioxygenase-like lactoylglutathione lyase family enzyme
VARRALDAADAFYRTIAPHTGLREGGDKYGRPFRGAWATFSLIADGRPPTEQLHMAFPAPDRAAYVLDPDGTNIESVSRDAQTA